MKIAINRCHGGFGLSDMAIKHMAQIQGITLFPEVDQWNGITYFTTPKESRSEDYSATVFLWRIDRTDKYLIETIETLGKQANGVSADLKIVDIPDDVKWVIDSYDGSEWIAEIHRTWM